MTQLLIDRVLLSGTQREIEEYNKLCNCTDRDWFFETYPKVLNNRHSDFHPMKSVAYLKAHSSNWRKRHKTTEWWQWLEDFRPDAGLEKHRFLLNPMANVFDCKKKRFIIPVFDLFKRKEHRYHEFWLERPLAPDGFPSTSDKVTRGRLIAYRFPHLAFRDYLFYRYNYMLEKDGGPFAMVPDEILLNMMGLNWQGQMVSTGFYDKKLNNVVKRFPSGQAVKKNMGHNQHTKGIRVMEIDHKDRDKFNDLPCNIRWVDRQMNLQNRGGRARP